MACKRFPRVMATIIMAAAVLLLSGTVYSFEPLFSARLDYGAGVGRISIFSTDLDGDGDNDLTVTNSNTVKPSRHVGNHLCTATCVLLVHPHLCDLRDYDFFTNFFSSHR